MNQTIDPESFENEIGEALNSLNSPKKLSESNLLLLSLVSEYKQKDPSALPYQVLRAVLTDILDMLETENADYADILRGRFWEGLSPASMITSSRPRQWSEKTFFNHQKKARQEFAALLWQKEQESLLEGDEIGAATGAQPAAQEALPVAVAPASRRVKSLLVVGALLLALALVAIYAAGGFRPLATVGSTAASTATNPANTPTTAASTPTTAASTPTTAAATAVSAPPVNLICGPGQAEPTLVDGSVDRFLRSEGVSSFTVENAPGVLNNKVRYTYIDQNGLWAGYFATQTNPASGLGHYDRASKQVANCNHVPALAGQNINAVISDQTGTLWVATEKNGLASFDGQEWLHYTAANGLPSNEIYGLTVDEENNLWAATWEGVAKFNGQSWDVPYTVQNGTLFNNHVHDILFDGQGNIWVGHIERGISKYSQKDGDWVHFTAVPGGLSGNSVRGLVLQVGTASESESIWIATQDGGVSQYQNGVWTAHRTENGLPSNRVRMVAIDRHNRVWAATSHGVAYWDAGRWNLYNTLDTHSLAFGITCPDGSCTIDDDHVWTGTDQFGLTQSRLPLPVSETPLDVNSVCFEFANEERVCPPIVADAATGNLSVAYPEPIAPGEQFQVYITVTPRANYALEEARGDMLSNTDADDANLFGRWARIKVLGTVEPGSPFQFADYDNLFTAPQLPENVQEQEFSSSWRVWRHNRYIGPNIRLEFTVKQP